MSFSCQYSMHVRRCNFALLVWRLQCIIYQLTTNHWAYAMFEYLCMRVYQMRGKWGEVDRHISWNSSNLGHLRLHSVLSVMMIIQIFALKRNNNNNNNRPTQISSPVCQQTQNSLSLSVFWSRFYIISSLFVHLEHTQLAVTMQEHLIITRTE